MKSTEKGIKRILKAFCYSYDGFIASFKSEAALRQDIALCTVLLGIALFLNIDSLSRLLLIFSLILIILMELVNTAIETVVDRISADYHDLSKKAKDIGSALVLIAFINALIMWSTVLFQFL